MILNQARVHDMYLEIMRNSPARLMPDYGLQLVDLSVAPDGDHPVTVVLEHADPPARPKPCAPTMSSAATVPAVRCAAPSAGS